VFSFASGELMAQERTVSGKVTSAEDGSGLPGVNVVVKGTTEGTVTDASGNYSLAVPSGSTTLVFSFIGLKTQEIEIGTQTTVSPTMEQDAEQLAEVVVVGYSTTTQQAFTGTAKVVSADNLVRKNVSNASRALAGEVAGLSVINNTGQPGSTANVRIRGFGSVNGNRDPLYVVDGVPFVTNATVDNVNESTGSLNSVNPADIESITVLKDAAATAIYGSRGANGVIIINTKSGKGKKSFIEVDGQFGTNASIMPRYDVIKSPEQYIGLSWEGLYNQGVSVGNANPTNYANTRLFSTSGIDPDYNMWNAANGAALIDPATRTVRDGVTRKYTPENWEDYAFQSSARSQVDVKFGGSNEKTNFYTSVGYLNDKGYSINSDYQRFSGRLNLNQEVTPWLNTAFTLAYTRSETNRGGQSNDSGSIFWFVDNNPSIYPLFMKDAAGNDIQDPIFGGPRYDYGEAGRKFGSLTNAIADATYDITRDYRNELNGSASANIDIAKGLTFENRLGFQYYNNKYVSRNNKYYGSAASQKGSLYNERTEMFTYNILNLLRYAKTFGDHSVEVLAAHEATEWTSGYLEVSAFRLVDNDLLEFNNAVVSNPVNSWEDSYSLESYFGQVNYDFQKKYFLSGSVRTDGSSRFLKDKWGTFGSIGAGWLISSEGFMSNQNLVKYLKLKASYGLMGEQNGIGYYPGYSLLYGVDNVDGRPGFSFKTKGNNDLTWETSRMFQTGLEFTIGEYLSGSIDFYQKNTKDLIFDRRVGPSVGFAIVRVNGGELRNQGLEFDLTGHLLKTDNAFVNLTVNGEILKNQLTSMPINPVTGQQKVIDVQGNFGWATGHSIFDFYVREWAGVDATDGRGQWTVYYLDTNGNGQYNTGEEVKSLADFSNDNPSQVANLQKGTTKTYSNATQMFIGKSAIPKVRGAINLAGGFKGFELTVQMLYRLGGYSYDGAYASLMSNGLVGGNNWHKDILGRWQAEGDVTDVPRISNNADANVGSVSSRFVTKANYLILNNVRLGYNIPKSVLDVVKVSTASVWISADNLWIKSKRAGFNPSSDEAGASSQYRYAPLSTISGGIKVKF
jgi:TonB-linked SusC/RagA family outer membrane protein